MWPTYVSPAPKANKNLGKCKTFNKVYTNAKNSTALGVRVNAIVGRLFYTLHLRF